MDIPPSRPYRPIYDSLTFESLVYASSRTFSKSASRRIALKSVGDCLQCVREVGTDRANWHLHNYGRLFQAELVGIQQQHGDTLWVGHLSDRLYNPAV